MAPFYVVHLDHCEYFNRKGACSGPVLLNSRVTADLIVLAAEFHVSIQAMSRALGTSIVTTLAIATLVWSMISVTWGKRPVYLAGTLFILAGCMVTGEGSYPISVHRMQTNHLHALIAKTYNVLLGIAFLSCLQRLSHLT
jgi:hypothetical protein